MEQKNTTPIPSQPHQLHQPPSLPPSSPPCPLQTSSTLTNTYFQVTISSQKLSNIFQKLNQSIINQNERIEILENNITNLSNVLIEKIESQSRKTGLLYTKLDMRIADCSNAQYCYVNQMGKKGEARDIELGNRVDCVNRKIGVVQDSIKEDIRVEYMKLKKEIFGVDNATDPTTQPTQPTQTTHDPSTQQTSQQSPLKPITQIKKIDFTSIIKYFEQQIKKIKETIEPTFISLLQKKQTEQKQKHIQEMLDLTYKNQLLDSSSSTTTKQNGKMRSMENNNKFVYPSFKRAGGVNVVNGNGKGNGGHGQCQEKQKKPTTRHLSLARNSEIQSDILASCYAELVEKVEKMDGLIGQYNNRLGDLKNKEVVIEQKVNIMFRKLQKSCSQIIQIKNTFRRFESQKQDDKSLQQIRHYIKWAIRDLQDKLTQKCTLEDLMKQKLKLTQKISIIHENLIQKADKIQIQKALVFLQGKIKQIIFLIAADQTQEKQGAIVKMTAKCLSCDKEVQRQVQSQLKCRRDIMLNANTNQNQNTSTSINTNKQNQGQYIKSMTHRVRQRYKKQMTRTAGNQQQNFDL